MNVHSTAVDAALLAELENLKRIRKGYSRPGKEAWVYSVRIDSQHDVLHGFPANVLCANISKVSVKRFVAAESVYSCQENDFDEVLKLLVPLSKYGKYQLQINDDLPVIIKYGYAYAFDAKHKHKIKVIEAGKKDFYMLILDCEK